MRSFCWQRGKSRKIIFCFFASRCSLESKKKQLAKWRDDAPIENACCCDETFKSIAVYELRFDASTAYNLLADERQKIIITQH